LYVKQLVDVFRELRRVLRDDSTFWLDIGDTFGPKGDWKRPGMVGIPHRLAFALQDDGWILAMEHIHSKPCPMTESVTNRCTKSHNYVFMFVKKAGYFFDQFAIREKATPRVRIVKGKTGSLGQATGSGRDPSGNGKLGSILENGDSRNKRSVWEVSHGGYKGAHFATFAPALILPCINAGTSEKGCCTECGSPWKRVVERVRQATRPGENSKITDVNGTRLNGEVTGNRDPERHVTSLRHLGWYPSCVCYGLPSMPPTPSAGDSGYHEWVRQARELCRQSEEEHGDSVEPCVVLDPFIGSGTTAVVCIGLGRYSMGIDLSEEYLKRNAIPRIEGELLGRPALATLVPR
jgi:DNA modification methylase